MFFLNLSLGEFLTLLASLSGLVTALYLLDRAKRKKVVSTLRFWTGAPHVDEQQRRKRIREPWSLLLQLLSLLLLLLAIGQLQWGSRAHSGRNHVIVLDTSAWMSEKNAAGAQLIESAKATARQYLASVPLRDRVMLIRADSIATPVTSFSDNRKQLLRAIDETTPSYTALNLSSALTLGYRALRWSNAGTGEVVFVGGSRVAQWDDENASVPGLRVLPVKEGSENTGIRRLSCRRDPESDDLWLASVVIRNYGAQPRTVNLRLRFAMTDFAARRIQLEPGEERSAEYKFTTTGPGTLKASIDPTDQLTLDDRVQLEVPAAARLRVAVFSDRAAAWQPLLESDKRILPVYMPVSQASAKPNADMVLFDGISPANPAPLPSLWILPRSDGSPIPVSSTRSSVVLSRWNADTPLAAGLRSKEMHLPSAQVFEPAASDVPIAFSDRGPIVVARSARGDRPRLAEIGFDPLAAGLKYDVSTPLLFANLLRWLEPESFRTAEVTATGVGSASIPLEPNEATARFRVVDDRGFAVPFTIRNNTLQLYTPRPGVVRIITPERERVLSLTLPGLGEFHWTPPPNVPRTMPRAFWGGPSAIDLWKWLAILGGLGLLSEWLFFGQQRPLLWRPSILHREQRPKPDRELVNR